MEKLKNKWNNMPLRRFFILTVLFSVGVVVLISALIIGGCAVFRNWLLPDSNGVYLTIEKKLADGNTVKGTYLLNLGDDLSSLPYIKYDDMPETESVQYSIEKFESGVDSLTPKRKLAYQVCGITMFAAPILLAFAAILLCGMYFYRQKLKQPLEVLVNATGQIALQNLDFEIAYICSDEMGDLCRSFEDMRLALYENNKAMWNMLEERRLMQASVAHDLRNPIAIIEGYTEYLEAGLKKGEIDREKITRIVQNLGGAAKRLEKYIESVRLLNLSEEAMPDRKPVIALRLAGDIGEDLRFLLGQKITLKVINNLPEKEIQVDFAMLYRILENIVSNAVRYARQEICIDFSLKDKFLFITVTDDGDGFPPDMLSRKEKKFIVVGKDGHMGIGLSLVSILCRKHGGKLELMNNSYGACVKISLSV